MGINVTVRKGKYNVLDQNEFGYEIRIWYGGSQFIWYVMEHEPEWQLPSHLIDAIEEDVSSMVFYSRRDRLLASIAEFRESQGALDTEWCDMLIDKHQNKIDSYDRLKAKIGEKVYAKS